MQPRRPTLESRGCGPKMRNPGGLTWGAWVAPGTCGAPHTLSWCGRAPPTRRSTPPRSLQCRRSCAQGLSLPPPPAFAAANAGRPRPLGHWGRWHLGRGAWLTAGSCGSRGRQALTPGAGRRRAPFTAAFARPLRPCGLVSQPPPPRRAPRGSEAGRAACCVGASPPTPLPPTRCRGSKQAGRPRGPRRTPWRRRDPRARPLTGSRAGTARPAAAGRAAPYHVGQRELGALSKHAAVHGDHGAAIVVQPVPVAALLIGQQVNPPVLENTGRRRVSSAARHLRPQRPKTGRSAEPAAAAPGPRPPRGPPSGTHAHRDGRRGARETRRASRGPSATGTVSPDSPERRHCPPPRGRHGRAEHTEPREAPEAQRQPDAPVPRATEPHGRAVPRWPRLAAMPTGAARRLSRSPCRPSGDGVRPRAQRPARGRGDDRAGPWAGREG